MVGLDSAKSWGKALIHVEPLEFPANQTGFLPSLPYRSAPHWRNGVSCQSLEISILEQILTKLPDSQSWTA